MKVEDSTLAVVHALERMGVDHDVTGSLASSLHGDPRSTNDADIVAALLPSHFATLQAELGTRFYATREHRSFNLIDEIELAKVDVFCVAKTGYQAEALRRAVRLELERDDPFSKAMVASPSDVIISKLRWYRLGNESSDRQWRDLIGVVRAQRAQLDLDYIRRWAREQVTEDLFDRLLAES